VGPWVKTFGTFKRGVRPAWMWEPVIFRGGRNPSNGHPHKPPEKGGKQTTPKDFAIIEEAGSLLAEPITLEKGLTGAKPEAFCEWVLGLLNVREGDEVVDLFPGTGVMGAVASRMRAVAA
jgi:DNA modification methylase